MTREDETVNDLMIFWTYIEAGMDIKTALMELLKSLSVARFVNVINVMTEIARKELPNG